MRLRYAALLSPFALIPLLLTSPVACGCLPDLTSVAGQMVIFAPHGTDVVPAESNQLLGEQSFIGKNVQDLVPGKPLDPECSAVVANRLRCIYWNAVGISYSSGRLVQISTDNSGKVVGISVRPIHKLFGMAFGTDA